MSAPAQQSVPAVQSSKPDSERQPAMEDMLRECIELCALVAERHSATEAAQQIRKLKPPSRWP